MFTLDAVRCFILNEQSKINMGDEATIELGFDQVYSERRLNLDSTFSTFPSVPEDVWSSIALTSCLDRLRVLGIDFFEMSDALLLRLLNKCRNSLKELKFSWCNSITASVVSIGECSELEVLQSNDAVSSRLSEIVGGLPKLRECNFSNCSSLTDEGVIGLAMSCPDLEILNLVTARTFQMPPSPVWCNVGH